MGFYFKEGYGPKENLQITEKMAKDLLNKLFSIEDPHEIETSASKEVFSEMHEDEISACRHIGEYIHDLMFNQDFSSIDITIIKDKDNQLVFNLNKTEL